MKILSKQQVLKLHEILIAQSGGSSEIRDDGLLDTMNYSLPYISKRFKDDTGITFVKYLQNYRVMQGCRLLTSSRRSLAEIAEKVGYKDVKFFSSLVKKMTGLSPADFRRTGGKK